MRRGRKATGQIKSDSRVTEERSQAEPARPLNSRVEAKYTVRGVITTAMKMVAKRSRLRLKFLISVIRLVVTLVMLVVPQSGFAQTIFSYAADPTYGGVGFVRAHWATSINKMLVFLVPGKNTSVRAYDPVTNTWEYLWPNDVLGIQGRDNFASFYIPRLDELWVWNGSYLQPGELYSGRFSVSQKKWLATGTTDSGAFAGIVDMTATGGMPFSGTDPAMAWAANADTGLMLGGSSESGEYTYIFEPKPGGPELYKASRLTIPRPPWRAQCMNCMVSDGKDFYLFGGFYQLPNDPTWRNRRDLWKFDTTTRTWIELPSPPDVENAPVVTYDSDRHALVSWVKNKLYVYDIASNQWSDQTPPGLACVSNQTGVYAPTAKLHLFEGGNDCVSGDSTYMTVAISLSGATQRAETITTSAPTLVSSAAALSQNSTPTNGIQSTVASTAATVPGGVAGTDTTSQANQTLSLLASSAQQSTSPTPTPSLTPKPTLKLGVSPKEASSVGRTFLNAKGGNRHPGIMAGGGTWVTWATRSTDGDFIITAQALPTRAARKSPRRDAFQDRVLR